MLNESIDKEIESVEKSFSAISALESIFYLHKQNNNQIHDLKIKYLSYCNESYSYGYSYEQIEKKLSVESIVDTIVESIGDVIHGVANISRSIVNSVNSLLFYFKNVKQKIAALKADINKLKESGSKTTDTIKMQFKVKKTMRHGIGNKPVESLSELIEQSKKTYIFIESFASEAFFISDKNKRSFANTISNFKPTPSAFQNMKGNFENMFNDVDLFMTNLANKSNLHKVESDSTTDVFESGIMLGSIGVRLIKPSDHLKLEDKHSLREMTKVFKLKLYKPEDEVKIDSGVVFLDITPDRIMELVVDTENHVNACNDLLESFKRSSSEVEYKYGKINLTGFIKSIGNIANTMLSPILKSFELASKIESINNTASKLVKNISTHLVDSNLKLIFDCVNNNEWFER
jgi:hypothetical protein